MPEIIDYLLGIKNETLRTNLVKLHDSLAAKIALLP